MQRKENINLRDSYCGNVCKGSRYKRHRNFTTCLQLISAVLERIMDEAYKVKVLQSQNLLKNRYVNQFMW